MDKTISLFSELRENLESTGAMLSLLGEHEFTDLRVQRMLSVLDERFCDHIKVANKISSALKMGVKNG